MTENTYNSHRKQTEHNNLQRECFKPLRPWLNKVILPICFISSVLEQIGGTIWFNRGHNKRQILTKFLCNCTEKYMSFPFCPTLSLFISPINPPKGHLFHTIEFITKNALNFALFLFLHLKLIENVTKIHFKTSHQTPTQTTTAVS